MASFTLTSSGVFPAGTSVGCYAASDWPVTARPPSGAAPGSAVDTQSMGATGTLTFTGLTAGVSYFAGASVGGTWRYVGFSVVPVSSPDVGDGSITDVDVANDAGIAFAKLAALASGKILVGNASSVPVAVTPSGDVTIDTAGVTAIGSSKVTSAMIVNGTIVNADVSASAAIADSKLDMAVVDARYRTLTRLTVVAVSATVTAAATYAVRTNGTLLTQNGTAANWACYYLDPAAAPLAISGRSNTLLRMVAAAGVADNAPANTMTLGLYPVGTPSGGTTVWNPNFGTVVPGSTIAFASPAANSKSAEVSSGDFACPAAGWYMLGLAADGAMGLLATVNFPLRLEVHNT